MTTTETFCLKWNDFQENMNTAFVSMRNDADFADVTLACEDGNQVEAHKFILAASSPFFQNLLKRNKHAHPIIYMRGIKSEDLLSIVNFLYNGETNICQDNLDDFLAIAEELKLKGLSNKEDKLTGEGVPPEIISAFKERAKRRVSKKLEVEITQDNFRSDIQEPNEMSEMSVALPNPVFSGKLKELDAQIKSMMSISTQSMAKGIRAKNKCQVCGKEGDYRAIKDHIELHHIDCVSHPCNLCSKVFRSRDSLKKHNFRNHKIDII